MNAQSSDDELILGLCREADRRPACQLLYRRYGGRFTQYLLRRGMDRASAEDAVQEAFIRLLRGAPGFQAQGQGRAWIWQVARSAWRDLARRSEPSTESLEAVGELPGAPDVAQTSDYQDCVHGQLARFATAYPEAGQAIIWAAVDGLSSAQIGALIERSAGATREFLSRSRRRLREYLEPCL